MPEIFQPQPEVVRDFANPETAKKIEKEIEEAPPEKPLQKIIHDLYPDDHFIAKGSGSVVVGHPTKEKVIAHHVFEGELKEKPIKALKLYHLHRIFNELFPHNFPRLHAIKGGKNAQSIRQKIDKSAVDIKYSFSNVREACQKIGLPLNIDDSSPNFIVGNDGGEYYLDMFTTSDIDMKKIEVDELQKYMNEEVNGQKRVKPERQKQILNSFDRLKTLEVVENIDYVMNNFEKLQQQNFDTDSSMNWLNKWLDSSQISNKKSIDNIIYFVKAKDTQAKELQQKIINHLKSKITKN